MHNKKSRPVLLIPAHAGVILSLATSVTGVVAYPRARGGDPAPGATNTESVCLSPRTRG